MAIRPLEYAAFPIEVENDTIRFNIEQQPSVGSVVIRRLDDRNVERWKREYRYPPLLVSAQRRNARIAELARLFFPQNDGAAPGAEQAVRAAVEFPEFMPLVSRAVLGRDGTLWLQRADGEVGASARWIILDPIGNPRGEVSVPNGSQLRAFAVRDDRAWIPMSDDTGTLWVSQVRINDARH
jgi:hypothetical protein